MRHELNQFVICAGLRHSLRCRVLDVASAISPVDVDHGETRRKTPDAASYIAKTLTYREQLATRRAAKKACAGLLPSEPIVYLVDVVEVGFGAVEAHVHGDDGRVGATGSLPALDPLDVCVN